MNRAVALPLDHQLFLSARWRWWNISDRKWGPVGMVCLAVEEAAEIISSNTLKLYRAINPLESHFNLFLVLWRRTKNKLSEFIHLTKFFACLLCPRHCCFTFVPGDLTCTLYQQKSVGRENEGEGERARTGTGFQRRASSSQYFKHEYEHKIEMEMTVGC